MKNVVKIYRQTESVLETARITGLSTQKVRRILLTAGEWSSPRTDEVARRLEAGQSIAEIADALGISEKSVMAHMPYKKGMYNSPAPTRNALAIRRHRGREKK